MIEKPKKCERCGAKNTAKIRRIVIANGASQYRWYCSACGKTIHTAIKNLKKKDVEWLLKPFIESGKIKSLDDITIVRDNRNESTQCVVCGSMSGEYHHWLPQCFRDIVPNFDDWPASQLCKPCHDFWHEIVTPYLNGRGKSEVAQHTIETYIKVMPCMNIK